MRSRKAPNDEILVSSCPKAKVRHLWDLGSSRIQACYSTTVLIVLKNNHYTIITRHPVVAAIICHAL